MLLILFFHTHSLSWLYKVLPNSDQASRPADKENGRPRKSGKQLKRVSCVEASWGLRHSINCPQVRVCTGLPPHPSPSCPPPPPEKTPKQVKSRDQHRHTHTWPSRLPDPPHPQHRKQKNTIASNQGDPQPLVLRLDLKGDFR